MTADIFTPERFRNQDLDTMDAETARLVKYKRALREIDYISTQIDKYAHACEFGTGAMVPHYERMLDSYSRDLAAWVKKFHEAGATPSITGGEIDE